MKKALFLILAAVMLSGSVSAANTQLHPAYLNGYPDGTVRPYAYLSRQELCQIPLRLLPEDAPCGKCGYLDVLPQQWSYHAVSTMLTLGIYPAPASAYFEPKKAVSVEEFRQVVEQAGKYLDALKDAAFSSEEAYVTRAACAEFLNAQLARCEHPGMQGMLGWSDLAETETCFADFAEACNTHTAQEGRWCALG